MASDMPTPVTELTQELRLATTMTGGVSLAIWMGGVAREINLLSQASQWRRAGGPFPADNKLSNESTASLKLYADLLNLLDLVVDVDVLSGTSAGGINAALLARSRVTGSDLGGLRELWLDLGSLFDLLRDPRDKDTPSLLYGDERMFAALAQQIPKLVSGPFPPEADAPSTTLYITTTLLNGETSRFTDSFGTLVQDVDRHGLFTFTENELALEATVPALALAARSSASFPAAFEPSFLPFTDATPKTKNIPARPPMAPYANITRPHWVADGGMLDNRPIGVLLERVFDRAAQRPVRRVLLFVVPSSGPAPDLVEEDPPDNVDEPLGLVDGLLKDLAAMTTQSIAADLRAIRTHQDRMEVRADTKLRLAEVAATLPAGTRLLSEPLLADYRKREATEHTRALVNALLRQLSTWPSGSRASAEHIPAAWEEELAVGGEAEKICREAIMSAILSHWPATPPQSSAALAEYDQAAYDLAKASALAAGRPAYQLAQSEADRSAVVALIQDIHKSSDPATRIDLAALVREVCTDATVRGGSLQAAAGELANRYLQRTTVSSEAWDNLGAAFLTHLEILESLAASVPAPATSDPEVEVGSQLDIERQAASRLTTYLNYLKPSDGAEQVATRLFDLAMAQRAMLPVDADTEQSFELVQVSADTRSLLAPRLRTAQQKLTGMQFHHFGAFYKRSWRANDWMWGRLDGAGWLVHVLLDPRRVQTIVQQREDERADDGSETGAQWFLGQLEALGAPAFPTGGYRLSAPGVVPEQLLTLDSVLGELTFLDDPSIEMPASLPNTSMWLAQAWQQRVLDEELDVLAKAVLNPEPGKKPDWSPAKSRAWAEKVRAASPGAAKYAHLDEDPVAGETLASDKTSPLMARTIAKAAATASGAFGSIRQLPGVLKPPVTTLRTLTLGGFRVVTYTKGVARLTIMAGAALLVLGVAAAIQDDTLFGFTGLIMAATGGYLIVMATWQISSRLLFALLSMTLVLAVFALATPVVREWLFGTKGDPGIVAEHFYWIGAEWWHPLVVVFAIALVVSVIAAAMPSHRRRT